MAIDNIPDAVAEALPTPIDDALSVIGREDTPMPLMARLMGFPTAMSPRVAVETVVSQICYKGIPTAGNLRWAALEAARRAKPKDTPDVWCSVHPHNGGYRMVVAYDAPLYDNIIIANFPPEVVKCLAHFRPACAECDAVVKPPTHSSWIGEPYHYDGTPQSLTIGAHKRFKSALQQMQETLEEQNRAAMPALVSSATALTSAAVEVARSWIDRVLRKVGIRR